MLIIIIVTVEGNESVTHTEKLKKNDKILAVHEMLYHKIISALKDKKSKLFHAWDEPFACRSSKPI